MTARGARQCVLAFLDGYYAGDVSRVEECCADTYTWLSHAPIEVFPHLGLKQGKAWLAESIRIQQERYTSRSYSLLFIAAEGLRVATMTHVTVRKRSDRRIIHLTVSDCFTLSGGRIREHHTFFDSLDLVQQLLGRDLTEPFATSVGIAMMR